MKTSVTVCERFTAETVGLMIFVFLKTSIMHCSGQMSIQLSESVFAFGSGNVHDRKVRAKLTGLFFLKITGTQNFCLLLHLALQCHWLLGRKIPLRVLGSFLSDVSAFY